MNTKMCLDIKTKNLKTNDIIWGVLESGHECEQMWIECETNDYDLLEVSRIKECIAKIRADIVITMNFCPTISKACFEMGIPYASWIYDSPVQALYHEEVSRDTNYFFIFDKYLYEVTKKRGVSNVFYLPLAANVTKNGQLEITKKDEKDFFCDVSFIGMQYIDGRFNSFRSELDGKYQDELMKIAIDMMGKWDGVDRVHGTLPEDLLARLCDIQKKRNSDPLPVPPRVYFEEAVIPRAVAYTERRSMMESIAGYNPRWYGADAADEEKIPGVGYYPRLTYDENLPKAYYLSRINLSTSLHSISSGVPLRVFDIMGVGGFTLTNYQPELEELFEVGKEIIVYHSFDEMKDYVKYFLAHEDERVKVLINGYKRICSDYTYPIAVKKILDTVFGSAVKG